LTGDIKNANTELLKDRTNNIVLTGFLPAKEDISLIVEADAILALLNDPLAMQASGYEAVAAEKILITSNHPPLKRYFTKGTIHVKNSAQDIKEAIIMARDKEDMLKKEMHELRLEKQKEWEEKITNLLRTINIEI
jgi:glycosyltransferase involved in cell wall biosynthesis